jgi:hypothetical protein
VFFVKKRNIFEKTGAFRSKKFIFLIKEWFLQKDVNDAYAKAK